MKHLLRLWLRVAVVPVIVASVTACSVLRPTPEPTATPSPTSTPTAAQPGAAQLGPTAPPAPVVGGPAPEFTLPTVDGKNASLSDYRGKKVLLVMFATWCPHCQSEAPHLVKAFSERSSEGLQVLGISLGETKDKVEAFQQQYGINYPLLLDAQGSVAALYYARSIPMNIFIDESGIIESGYLGAFDEPTLKEYLDQFLQ